jgi:hypothetical protein
MPSTASILLTEKLIVLSKLENALVKNEGS